MADTRPGLTRQGSVARTNAIAMLKRAASQREIKARADTPTLSGAFPADPSPPPSTASAEQQSSITLGSSQRPMMSFTTVEPAYDWTCSHGTPTFAGQASMPSNASSDQLASRSNQHCLAPHYGADNAMASTSFAPASPSAMLTAPSPNDSSDLSRSRSPMFQDRSNQRNFNKSPLPSLEQLRARILLERESAGLQQSASTSAASQAARAYALEKLLGNSGTDVFYDHTPDGTPIGRGAATPSPTSMSGRDNDLTDMASDDESAHETRLKRQSIKHRPGLRRSRTINGLTAMAEAQNKAEFVQGVFLAVPGPASNRISRIHQRRVERQSMLKAASISPSELSVPDETMQEPVSPVAATEEAAAPSLSRQQSQRQIARTEMMRKLSTRGRGNPGAAASDVNQNVNGLASHVEAEQQQQHPRLPKVITDSPAVDETISPVGVVIRPPSSPVPPFISHLNPGSSSPTPVFRQALSPASAAGTDAHHYSAAPTEDDHLPLSASSPGLKASSSAASLASNYAPSTGTARHIYERDRESRMAILNNEDSFGYEASPWLPSTSVDVGGLHSASKLEDGGDADTISHAYTANDGNMSENDGLDVDFGDSRRKRRAGLVGLGLDSVPQQGASDVAEGTSTWQPTQSKDSATLSPGKKVTASPGKRVSKLRQSLARLRVQPNTQDMLSSPASQTDEEALEDDAFYKLYSPAPGGFDDDDDETDEDGQGDADTTQLPQVNGQTSARDPTAIQGLGLIHSSNSPTNLDSNKIRDVVLPTTPPQHLFRGNAAVPCDPSPSTQTEFGEARRTPWMASSPGGFNLPLRLSNSLMSTAQAIATDSPAPDPSPVMRNGPNASRKARGDWPMSVASSGTAPLSRESLESRNETESRLKSSEEAGVVSSNVPAIGSPLFELPEDEVMQDTAVHQQQHSISEAEGNNGTTDSEFELLSVPTRRAKPSERVQAMLGSSFVAEYGGELSNSRSRSSVGADEQQQPPTGSLRIPTANGSALSNNNSSVSINEISDMDGEVDDAYLRKVDRMADKLGKLARNKTIADTGSRSAVMVSPATTLERSNTGTGSRFTEHAGVNSSHSQRPSADLSALVGNGKLHPFPGLSQASPLQNQERFSPMAVSTAPTVSPGLVASVQSRGVQQRGSESPPSASASGEQEGVVSGKQIGLFSSLRRKASSLRRTPSAAANNKEGSSFWARRGKREESPKMPSEATFISAPILTSATPGPGSSVTGPTQLVVTVDKPRDEVQRENDGTTFEHRLFEANSSSGVEAVAGQRERAVDLQRNASISSVVSARVRNDLQDGTADMDSSESTPSTITSTLAPNTAIMLQRYSRILSTTHPSHPITIPGLQPTDIIDPPRKLIASDPVFQVISSTTIKDRFLFLFSDLLVIAKPISAPGSEAGKVTGKMKQSTILPDLNWKFAVKNILELHRVKVSVTTNTRTTSSKRSQNPVLLGFVSHFSRDPESAVRALVAKTGLDPTPASIAQLLYQTPELDRDDLTRYLTHPSHRDILKSYVSQHRHLGVSIESALRSLLLDLRFPRDLDAFEALLVQFAQSWTHHNKGSIKEGFSAGLASDLVFAIMALNDALHTGEEAKQTSGVAPNFPRPVTVVTPGLFSAGCPQLSKEDFVNVFRQHDPAGILSDRTLSRIYLSIKAEPLVQALDRYEPRFTIRVKGGKLPTRMTYAQPAEAVTLVIPAPDPDLAIRLYAQDMTFEPPVLTFGKEREASFTMWTKSLGAKQVVFVRAGRNARFYGGCEGDLTTPISGVAGDEGGEDTPLPRSFNVTVERAFMKHSFTLTSINPSGSAVGERKFMLSFEDGNKVSQWIQAIKDGAEKSIKLKAQKSVSGDGVNGRAIESASLQILRETLVSPDSSSTAIAPSPTMVGGLGRAATITGTTFQPSNSGSRLGLGLGHPPPAPSSNSGLGTGQALLDRTTSTSRHYYATTGVGRHERELLLPPASTTTSSSKLGTGVERGLVGGHTKGSASLSLYPPSLGVTVAGGVGGVGRSNSARSASSPHSPQKGLPSVAGAEGRGMLNSAASITASAGGAVAGMGGNGEGKIMQGTQIVSVTRLNSLLSRVIGFLQQQQQQQQ